MMFEHLGQAEAARRIESAIETVLTGPKEAITRDLGWVGSTASCTEALLRALGVD